MYKGDSSKGEIEIIEENKDMFDQGEEFDF